MEVLINVINLSILLIFILTPFYLIKRINSSKIKFKIITYLFLGLVVNAVICFAFAWWSDTSNEILLKHLNGYIFNPDSGNYQVSYEQVLPENIEKVKSLETSIMGIGWPLKAIFMFVFYSPILIISFIVERVLKKNKNKKTTFTNH